MFFSSLRVVVGLEVGRSLCASHPSVGYSRRLKRHWVRQRPSLCPLRYPRHVKTRWMDSSTTVAPHVQSVGPSWWGVVTPIDGYEICVAQLDQREGMGGKGGFRESQKDEERVGICGEGGC